MLVPQPGQFLLKPANLGPQLVALSDSQAVDNLPQPLYLGLQVTLAARRFSPALAYRPPLAKPTASRCP